ncbi:MAG: Laminin subunit beta-1, partial [Micromonosporaceae bacterium]|nr:Laminin subunit beta-1 [Micromonosporaceae bacterium]
MIEAEIAALAAERENAYDQVQALSAQVHQLNLEIAELRRRGNARIEQVSFDHLGQRVAQILSTAEEEARSIRGNAVSDIDKQREEAERLLADAREQHAQAIRDFEAALAARRAEEERIAGERRTMISAEISAGQEYAARLRTEADTMKAKAHQDARRITEAAAAQAEQMRAETEAYVQHQRAQVDQESVTRRASLEAELKQLRGQADQLGTTAKARGEQEGRRILEEARQQAESALSVARTQGERIVAEARRQADLAQQQAADAAA